ncbi:hypothetical protein [Streptomyces sp. CAU 1734]|uniref:hypothetical protein n=1 Tax=Streptomyces sp. CAU 1734 TaxID=3140360 RepID=UPI00326036EB
MTTITDSAMGEWLAESLADPRVAWGEWRSGSFAMLPAGVRFDAVRISGELVHAVVGDSVHDGVAAWLTGGLAGPVICDTGHWYYALLPPGSTGMWPSGLVRRLGRGAWVGVPRPDLTGHTGLHWCVPMTYPAVLCDTGAVSALIERGHGRLAGKGRG